MTNSADQKVERRLAAILAADVVGYSSLMGRDDEGTLARIKSLRHDLIEPKLAEHRGRVFKTTGDGLLAEFSSPVEAVRCAVELQGSLTADPSQMLQLRIGINLGDVMIEPDGDIYGDGVNVAARLEQLADPGGICVSAKVYEEVRDKLRYTYDDRGEHQVKNIARPLRVYSLSLHGKPPRMNDTFSKGSHRPAVTVLPFVNMSGDPTQQYFADGLTEDVVTALLRVSGTVVVSGASRIGRPQSEHRTPRANPTFLLEGSVRRSGNRARATTQLTSPSGEVLWSDKYDFELNDVFAVQDELARSITAALKIKVEEHEHHHALTKPPTNLDAYDYCLRGRHLGRSFHRSDRQRAQNMFLSAIEADPEYARGYIELAWLDIRRLKWGEASDPDAALARALDAATTATTLDPNDADCHWMLGLIHLWKRDHAKSIVCYERARTISPNHPDLLADMCDMLGYAGRPEEAIEVGKMAVRLNPNPPDWYLWDIGAGYYLLGDYNEAMHYLQRIAQPGPAYRLIAATYARLGRPDDAMQAGAELLKINPEFSISRYAAQAPYANREDLDRYVTGLRMAGLPE
ncbi:adenylate/guanylate cyclase domain-containing protein [Mesorhizobium sp. LjNodule214]|uniref:adenylate/guanylate cyclase domain-containing protein n=1 Tax=Mesorhizobium sp. LjNodule214 TaxID=3342252 RepID=UPI003ED1028E